MKFKRYVCHVPLISIFCNCQVLAQENVQMTPEQVEAIRQVALEINTACPIPAIPAIPDGNSATRDDMQSSQDALKIYIDEGNAYLGCLIGMETTWGENITANQTAVVNSLYNSAVEDLQSSADAFNTQLRLFKDNQSE